MPPNDRVKRPPPEDTGPDRSGWSDPGRTGARFGHQPPGGPSRAGMSHEQAPPPPNDSDTQYSDAVADSVKLAYAVIRDNIAQGRAAASKFRDGEYNVRDVPHDVNVLSLRLLNLTRELSRTSFDILEGILSNPRTPGATAWRPGPPTQHDPRQFHPAAGPFNPDWNYTGAYSRQGAAQPGTQMIPINCVFTGAGTAQVRSASLSRPQSPTHLALPVLASLKTGSPPIMGATITPTSDPYGVMVDLAIPAGQPAGVYSGAILDDQGYAVGALTIEVFAEAP
jgi:hypothetical protein